MIVIDVVAGGLLIACWYFWFVRYNRRKSLKVLTWIERAFEGHGNVAGVQWLAASRFKVRLRLLTNLFRNASVTIQLYPREMPLNWIISLIRRRQETFTFEADLDCPPSFNLEVNNHRWCGRTRRRLPRSAEKWVLERTAPFVITTRTDWQREITNMMHPLVASRECDCFTVSFRRSSPHFSATIPLNTISPESEVDAKIFDVMRELAAGASASRF
ncbi:MAG TPA: hypothetical protein VD837_06145 [Terriglobales bacterium]|nr:hypothetical protein [Terriglobales bacterium]